MLNYGRTERYRSQAIDAETSPIYIHGLTRLTLIVCILFRALLASAQNMDYDNVPLSRSSFPAPTFTRPANTVDPMASHVAPTGYWMWLQSGSVGQVPRIQSQATGSNGTIDSLGFMAVGRVAAVNVQAYGAKGDNTADDTAAFNSGLSSAAVLGKAVYVPPTNSCYKITSTISLTASIFGQGTKSKICSTTANTRIFSIANQSHLFVTDLFLSAATDKLSSGISITDSSDILIARNRIENFGNYGIIGTGTNVGSGLSQLRIYDNLIQNGQAPSGNQPIDIYFLGKNNDFDIERNKTLSPNQECIDVSSTDPQANGGPASDGIIAFNTCNNKSTHGIVVYQSTNATGPFRVRVADNDISTISSLSPSTTHGICIYILGAVDTIVHHNNVRDCLLQRSNVSILAEGAISISGGAKNVTVDDNIIREIANPGANLYRGIDVNGGSAVVVRGNIVDGTSHKYFQSCLQIVGSTDTLVEGNYFQNCASQAILTRNTVDRTTFSANVITLNGVGIQTSNGMKTGFYRGNFIYLNQQQGMALQDTAATIDGNFVYDNGKASTNTYEGILLQPSLASSKFVITNNQAYDDQSTPTQRYGIRSTANVTSMQFAGNTGSGNVSGLFQFDAESGRKPK